MQLVNSSVQHLPHYHYCVVCFVLTTATLTHPLVWNSSFRSRRKFKRFWKEVIGNVEISRRVKAIVSRWSFLSLQGKKRSKITIQNNTYCSRIQVAFSDTSVILRWLPKFLNFAVDDFATLWYSQLLFFEQQRHFPQNNENGLERSKKCWSLFNSKNATWSLIRPCLNFCKSLFPGSSLISYPVNVFRIPLVFWSNSGSREYRSRPSNTKKKLP